MSTIEKALEKLNGSQVSSTEAIVNNDKSLEQESVNISQPAPAQSESVASRRKSLDLERLGRLGFLTPESGRSQLAEEMRNIKRPLLLNAAMNADEPHQKKNIIMITSSKPSEGKSYTSLNLAMSIAKERDKTVLLVDADVARPGLTKTLAMEGEKGLVDYLAQDDLGVADIMLKTNVPNFRFIPAGRKHIHSTELLSSQSMVALANELSVRYPDRIILFDSPPLLATSEAAVLAGLVDQIVMVVEAEKTSKQELEEALGLIDQNNKCVGLVLNKARGSYGSDYYGYYGSYGS
jgi:protein-tyrosine kinase